MGYGPYWNNYRSYSISPEEVQKALQLTDWAANRLAVSFPAIDAAKTADGDWIIIEVNDAQESGFAGIDPFRLWSNTINAMQNRNWLPVEELFEEGTVILVGDPLPDKTLEEMWAIAKNYRSTQELIDAYAGVHNKFW